jgi:hypothetical protein
MIPGCSRDNSIDHAYTTAEWPLHSSFPALLHEICVGTNGVRTRPGLSTFKQITFKWSSKQRYKGNSKMISLRPISKIRLRFFRAPNHETSQHSQGQHTGLRGSCVLTVGSGLWMVAGASTTVSAQALIGVTFPKSRESLYA